MSILYTEHGSYLYGLNHSGSDYDTYEVVRVGRTRQKVADGLDHTTVALSDFLDKVQRGVPQALEALWSPVKQVDPDWEAFLSGLQPDYYRTIDTYQRTIKNFLNADSSKKWKHAVRMSFNLRDFKAEGVFNPRLTPAQLYVVLNAHQQEVAARCVYLNTRIVWEGFLYGGGCAKAGSCCECNKPYPCPTLQPVHEG